MSDVFFCVFGSSDDTEKIHWGKQKGEINFQVISNLTCPHQPPNILGCPMVGKWVITPIYPFYILL